MVPNNGNDTIQYSKMSYCYCQAIHVIDALSHNRCMVCMQSCYPYLHAMNARCMCMQGLCGECDETKICWKKADMRFRQFGSFKCTKWRYQWMVNHSVSRYCHGCISPARIYCSQAIYVVESTHDSWCQDGCWHLIYLPPTMATELALAAPLQCRMTRKSKESKEARSHVMLFLNQQSGTHCKMSNCAWLGRASVSQGNMMLHICVLILMPAAEMMHHRVYDIPIII